MFIDCEKWRKEFGVDEIIKYADLLTQGESIIDVPPTLGASISRRRLL